MCQACGKQFIMRRDTLLYHLKTHSEKVALALAQMAEGMDVSALERVTGISEWTLRTWLTRAGMHPAFHGVEHTAPWTAGRGDGKQAQAHGFFAWDGRGLRCWAAGSRCWPRA
jgi:hypothetical protein